MKRSLSLVILIAVFAALASSASAGGRYPTDCGRYGHTGKLKTLHVHCKEARRVVTKFIRKAQEEGATVRARGFDCLGTTPGRELDVFCSRRRGDQLIHWRGTRARPPTRHQERQ